MAGLVGWSNDQSAAAAANQVVVEDRFMSVVCTGAKITIAYLLQPFQCLWAAVPLARGRVAGWVSESSGVANNTSKVSLGSREHEQCCLRASSCLCCSHRCSLEPCANTAGPRKPPFGNLVALDCIPLSSNATASVESAGRNTLSVP